MVAAVRSSRSVSGPYRSGWRSTWLRCTCQASHRKMSSNVPAISVRADPSTSVTGKAWASRSTACRQGGGDGGLEVRVLAAAAGRRLAAAWPGGPRPRLAGEGGEDPLGDRDVGAEDADMIQ